MEFKRIREEIYKEFEEDLKQTLEKLNTEEGLNYLVRWSLNKRESYKGDFLTQKKKATEALTKKAQKDLRIKLQKLQEIEEAPNFNESVVITIEWVKSRVWGYNPRATDNFYNEVKDISGCGYDKLSTATAQILNKHNPILKELCKVEEERLKTDKDRRDFIDYGLGYGIIPTFERGVGVNCHERIINKIGLKWETITNTNRIDVFKISKE